jgi:hypothetical protein
LRWDAATLYGKLHLLGEHRSLIPHQTIASYDYHAFLDTGQDDLPPAAVLDLLGTEFLILPSDVSPGEGGWREVVTDEQLANVAVWQNTQPFPPVWIVHRVLPQISWQSTDPQAIRRYYHQLVFPAGQARDFREVAIVETADPAGLPAVAEPSEQAPTELSYVSAAGHGRIDVDVRLATSGLVVLNQFYDPHWVVDIHAQAQRQESVPPVRVNRIMQGIFLPAGRYRLVWRYVPWHLYAAAAVSLASWLAVLAALCEHRTSNIE